MTPLLEIKDLSVEFTGWQGTSQVLERLNLGIGAGEILGLVGESGCGKSVTARSVLGIIPRPPGKITSGEIYFQGKNLLSLSAKEMRKIRGNEISMIFQEPMSSLNPVFTVGNQMMEVVRLHRGLKREAARQLCADMLQQVQMPDPFEILKKYPHELSGGMRQRVMIALELACDPKLLIADEPTTALDVTVQGQVLAILKDLSRRKNVSVLLITHDMGVVAQLCDRVAVMYAGQLVEAASVTSLFAEPLHPYTQGLIAAIPKMEARKKGGEASLFTIPGNVPNLINPPSGCRFHPRCAFPGKTPECNEVVPQLTRIRPDHMAACCGLKGREI